MHLYEILKRPLTTEKTNRLKDDYRQYAFEVDLRANKSEIAAAVETAFPNIKVMSVNVMRMSRKRRHHGRRVIYKAQWKKAIVRIPGDQRIELFEGV
ncbi:MAG: 50S ribosomal protein L23 [Chloroflexi bacterium]|nr:50S ribosomal protein L23 [Chloroflexota bacterium]